jgi:MFS family permease
MTVRERAYVPTLIFSGLVVALISSLGAPLIPTIAADMHASVSSAQWSLTATLLVGAVASPTIGRLGDGRHRKRLILVCLLFVALGGALSALAGSLAVLVAGRAMQGMGLALVPLLMASARDRLAPAASSRVIATLSVVVGIGIGVGYPVTGLIAEHADVAVAFWFGAIGAAAALVLAALVIPDEVHVAARGRLDVVGAATIGLGLVALLFALEKAPDWGWVSTRTLALLAAAAVLFALWARHELAVGDPIVDLRLVRHRAVLTADAGGLLIGIAMYIAISLVTQFVQLPAAGGFGLGQSAFVAGLALIPLSAGSYLASQWLPQLRRRVGIRALIPAGAIIIGLGALFFVLTSDGMWQICVTMALVGIGLGWTYAAMPALIVAAVPHSETASATAFYQVSRYVGFAIGSGLSVTLLRAFGEAGVPTLDAFRATFLVAALLCAVTAAGAWLLLDRGIRA